MRATSSYFSEISSTILLNTNVQELVKTNIEAVSNTAAAAHIWPPKCREGGSTKFIPSISTGRKGYLS